MYSTGLSRHFAFKLPTALLLALLLSACNGGSGGDRDFNADLSPAPNTDESDAALSSAPSTPTLALTPQSIKSFQFSWEQVEHATEYRLLEDPDSLSGYTPIATFGADELSHALEVFLPGRINARYILEACNSIGCSDSAAVQVEGSLVEAIGYIKASNTDPSDAFGVSVALAKDSLTLAVGATGERSNATGIDGDQGNNSVVQAGAVYIFTRTDGAWSQQAYIKASNTSAGDAFGRRVALSADGNTLAVGAYRENSDATGVNGDQVNDDAPDSGAVYVFTRSEGSWSQQAYVKASNTSADAMFGWDLTLAADGNTLAVAALFEGSNATGVNGDQSNDDAPGSGAVYVFTRSEGGWSQQAYVKASNASAGNAFGASVALNADGNTLAVGSTGESSSMGIGADQINTDAPDSGAVYVFTRSEGEWSQQDYLKASNTSEGSAFGHSVALDNNGNTLAVGAYAENSSATGINGDEANLDAPESGAVYVFTRSEGAWSQQAYVKASNTNARYEFGRSVALANDGNTLAVGSRRENSSATGLDGDQSSHGAPRSGAVYVFTQNAGIWSQQAYVKASNTGAYDEFGSSIALSGSGDSLAVGAAEEASNATGINGDQTNNKATNSGAVYLY